MNSRKPRKTKQKKQPRPPMHRFQRPPSHDTKTPPQCIPPVPTSLPRLTHSLQVRRHPPPRRRPLLAILLRLLKRHTPRLIPLLLPLRHIPHLIQHHPLSPQLRLNKRHHLRKRIHKRNPIPLAHELHIPALPEPPVAAHDYLPAVRP